MLSVYLYRVPTHLSSSTGAAASWLFTMDVAGVDLPFSIADEGVIPPSPGSIKCSMQGADREDTLCSIPLSCMPCGSISLHVELNVQIQPPIFGAVEVALTVDVGDHLVPRHSHADGIFVDVTAAIEHAHPTTICVETCGGGADRVLLDLCPRAWSDGHMLSVPEHTALAHLAHGGATRVAKGRRRVWPHHVCLCGAGLVFCWDSGCVFPSPHLSVFSPFLAGLWGWWGVIMFVLLSSSILGSGVLTTPFERSGNLVVSGSCFSSAVGFR